METLLRVMWQPGWERSLGQNGYIYVCPLYTCNRASPEAQLVKNLPASAGGVRDEGLIPGLGRSPGEGNGNLLQYSYLESSMDRGAWRATVHGVAKSQTLETIVNIDNQLFSNIKKKNPKTKKDAYSI